MLKIVSYNLRSVWDGDGANAFPNRAGGILEKIREEKPDVIEGQGEGETPVITIETDNSFIKQRQRTPWIIGTAIITLIFCIVAVSGYRYYRRYINRL